MKRVLSLIIAAVCVLSLISCKKHVHDFGEWETVTEASCTEKGEKKRGCRDSECGMTETAIIPATGHQYSAVTVEATCSEGGYVQYTCACGSTYRDNEIPALGHQGIGQCTVCKKCYNAEIQSKLRTETVSTTMSGQKVSADGFSYDKSTKVIRNRYTIKDSSGLLGDEVIYYRLYPDGSWSWEFEMFSGAFGTPGCKISGKIEVYQLSELSESTTGLPVNSYSGNVSYDFINSIRKLAAYFLLSTISEISFAVDQTEGITLDNFGLVNF